MGATTCSPYQRWLDAKNLTVAKQRLGGCRGEYNAYLDSDPEWVRRKLRDTRRKVKARRKEARANRKRNGRQS